MIIDHYNRNIDYIRISITDRCNLRCRYCMPEDVDFVSHDKILRYEEILRILRILAEKGIRKVKITGGEPLVRIGCTDLIREIKQIPGIEVVTLTTNGVLLHEMFPKLLEAGIDAVNVSLDTLQEERYLRLSGRDACKTVLDGIQDVYESGIPLKINCVPIRGENTEELSDFFAWARDKNIAVRFIEMMPIGYGKTYQSVPSDEILRKFYEEYPGAYRLEKSLGNGPAVYYSAPGFAGEIGLIGAIHEKFCSTCNRIRLTSEGFLKLCLYSGEGLDVRSLLRGGCSDEEIAEAIAGAIQRKPKEHHFAEGKSAAADINAADADMRKMSQIGG